VADEVIHLLVDAFLVDLAAIGKQKPRHACELLLCAHDLGIESPRLTAYIDQLAKDEPTPELKSLVPAIVRQLVFTRFNVHDETRRQLLGYWFDEKHYREIENIVTVSFLVALALENLPLLSPFTDGFARRFYLKRHFESPRVVAWSIYHLAKLGYDVKDRSDEFLRSRKKGGSWDHDAHKTAACVYPLLLAGVAVDELRLTIEYLLARAAFDLPESPAGRAALLKTLHLADRVDDETLARIRETAHRAGTIFLSHTGTDKDFIRRLAGDLRTCGVIAWTDDENVPGDSVYDKIEAALSRTDCFGVAISARSVESDWVRREINMALQRPEVKVIPLRIDRTEIPLRLRDYVHADFRTSYDIGLKELLRALAPPSSEE
jgi:hypothetical protein